MRGRLTLAPPCWDAVDEMDGRFRGLIALGVLGGGDDILIDRDGSEDLLQDGSSIDRMKT